MHGDDRGLASCFAKAARQPPQCTIVAVLCALPRSGTSGPRVEPEPAEFLLLPQRERPRRRSSDLGRSSRCDILARYPRAHLEEDPVGPEDNHC